MAVGQRGEQNHAAERHQPDGPCNVVSRARERENDDSAGGGCLRDAGGHEDCRGDLDQRKVERRLKHRGVDERCAQAERDRRCGGQDDRALNLRGDARRCNQRKDGLRHSEQREQHATEQYRARDEVESPEEDGDEPEDVEERLQRSPLAFVDAERDFAARDVTVDRQHLPPDFPRPGDRHVRGSRKRAGRLGMRQRDRLLRVVGRLQHDSRSVEIDPTVEVDPDRERPRRNVRIHARRCERHDRMRERDGR